jgi:Zn-finger nucleic acid-binding protein
MRQGSEVTVVQVELKYCEACGGLWLRARGSAEVYCARCAEKMGEIALGKAGRHVN